jgi:glycosyltransferase involved in cell wall biosynthesis
VLPRISVYITSYNQKAYLGEAIDSVLAQTLLPCEIVIVDDCSTDRSQELIEGYRSRYPDLIVPVYHSCNQGVARTRTDALRTVAGDYVTYVDGDDRFLSTKLEKEARVLEENPGTGIVFSNYYYISEDGVRSGVWADGEDPPQGCVFRQTFARRFPRRSLFRNELVNYQAWKRVGSYDPALGVYEDYEMRIRLTKQLSVAYCDEPLAEYRVHGAGLSRGKAVQQLAALEYIYEKNRHLLNDLSMVERRDVQRELGGWLAGIAERAAVEVIDGEGHAGRWRALRYWRRCLKYRSGYVPYRLFVRFFFPRAVYTWLRSMPWRAWERGSSSAKCA